MTFPEFLYEIWGKPESLSRAPEINTEKLEPG